MSDSTTPPVAPATGTDVQEDNVTLDEFVKIGKGADGSSIENRSAVLAMVAAAVALIAKYTPLATELDALIDEGVQVCMSLRKLCLRADNGKRDWYGRTKVYGRLWRDFTGTGSYAERFRSAVASRISLHLVIQTEVARDLVAAGSVRMPKVKADGTPAMKNGKPVTVVMTSDDLEALISAEAELPQYLREAIDAELSTQVYEGKGKSAGLRVQGAEQPIKAFGKRPAAPKGSRGTGPDAPDSAATGGNASALTPAGAWDLVTRGSKESLHSRAENLYRTGSAIIGKAIDAEPGADLTEAMASLDALAKAIVYLRAHKDGVQLDGKTVTAGKVKTLLYVAPKS